MLFQPINPSMMPCLSTCPSSSRSHVFPRLDLLRDLPELNSSETQERAPSEAGNGDSENRDEFQRLNNKRERPIFKNPYQNYRSEPIKRIHLNTGN